MARALQMSDFEMGQMLQERILPRAVLYFTGEALDEESDGEVRSLNLFQTI